MTKQIITLPATLEGVTRRKDRSVSLRFSSLFETTNEDFSKLDGMFQASGYLLFSDEQIGLNDIPDEEIKDTDLKSPSSRLRDVLFVLHKQRGGNSADFRQFYESQMEKVIEAIKERLE